MHLKNIAIMLGATLAVLVVRCKATFLAPPINRGVGRCEISWINPQRKLSVESFSISSRDSSQSDGPDLFDIQETLLQQYEPFQRLCAVAGRRRTWQRLSPMVTLATLRQPTKWKSVTDIGTDHGLLAFGLAATNRFEKVLGVDVSPHALKHGAIQNLEEMTSKFNDGTPIFPCQLAFRQANGLWGLNREETEVICMSGMGASNMIKILSEKEKEGKHLLDRLDCRRMVLQPAVARPKYLMPLYSFLYESGWTLTNELIAYTSNRWYLSSLFERETISNHVIPGRPLPGSMILSDGSDHRSQEKYEWMKHHCGWIREDAKHLETIPDDELEWLAAAESILQ
jgi:tRNA A22 N-methylase